LLHQTAIKTKRQEHKIFGILPRPKPLPLGEENLHEILLMEIQLTNTKTMTLDPLSHSKINLRRRIGSKELNYSCYFSAMIPVKPPNKGNLGMRTIFMLGLEIS